MTKTIVYVSEKDSFDAIIRKVTSNLNAKKGKDVAYAFAEDVYDLVKEVSDFTKLCADYDVEVHYK